jgi:hypothetical protein
MDSGRKRLAHPSSTGGLKEPEPVAAPSPDDVDLQELYEVLINRLGEAAAILRAGSPEIEDRSFPMHRPTRTWVN